LSNVIFAFGMSLFGPQTRDWINGFEL